MQLVDSFLFNYTVQIYKMLSKLNMRTESDKLSEKIDIRSQRDHNEHYNDNRGQSQPSDLQFKLQKLLRDSASRQQSYLKLIKQQQEELYRHSEQYLQSLKKYEKILDEKLSNKDKAQYKKYSHLKINNNTQIINNPVNKFNKTQFTVESSKHIQLHCSINFIYYTPIIRDFYRQTYPKSISIKGRLEFPFSPFNLKANLKSSDQDEDEILDSLVNQYPFQLVSLQNVRPGISFIINNESNITETLKYFNGSILTIQIYDSQSQFLICEGKIALKQFLYYGANKQQWVEKIVLYSPFSSASVNSVKKAYIHIQFSNLSKEASLTQNHKVNSQAPIQLKAPIVNKYSDIQSRMIQRINRFKINHNTLVPQMHIYDEKAADQSLLMHLKKKQLENIDQYKKNHKSEYMEQVLSEALQKFSTVICQLGQCKYIPLIFVNPNEKMKKVHMSFQEKLLYLNSSPKQLDENSCWQFITPNKAKVLIRQGHIQKISEYQMDYEYQQTDNSIWVAGGDNVTIIFKFLDFKTSQLTKNHIYELNVKFSSQFGQTISQEILRVRLRQPIYNQTLYLHGYSKQDEEIQIYVGENDGYELQSTIKKMQFLWDKTKTFLNLKIKHTTLANNKHERKTQYIYLYDKMYCKRKNCFRLINTTYHEIKSRSLQYGEIGLFKFEVYGKDIVQEMPRRVKICVSQPISAKATYQNFPEFNAKKDQIYVIDIKFQSFKSNTPAKLLINFIDYLTNQVLKESLLQIPITFKPQKSLYKIFLPSDDPKTHFKFSLRNPKNQENNFRMYSSNQSILTVSDNLIKLYGKQALDVDLGIQITNKNIMKNNQQEQNVAKVFLVTTDGTQVNRYLFQIQLGE